MCFLKVRLEVIGNELEFQVLEMDESIIDSGLIGNFKYKDTIVTITSISSPEIQYYIRPKRLYIYLRGSYRLGDDSCYSVAMPTMSETEYLKEAAVEALRHLSNTRSLKFTSELNLHSCNNIFTIGG